jgi:hypothetical protein
MKLSNLVDGFQRVGEHTAPTFIEKANVTALIPPKRWYPLATTQKDHTRNLCRRACILQITYRPTAYTKAAPRRSILLYNISYYTIILTYVDHI